MCIADLKDNPVWADIIADHHVDELNVFVTDPGAAKSTVSAISP